MESQQTSGTMYNNVGYNNTGVIQIRLNTEDLIDRIESFLSGTRWIPQTNKETGVTEMVRVNTGTPLANCEGVQSLVNFVSGLINPSVVQGNYTGEQYYNHVDRINRQLIDDISENWNEWGMSRNNRSQIISFIMNLVEPFLSRLIDNKERESYSDTIRSLESSRVEKERGMSLNPWGSGGGSQ